LNPSSTVVSKDPKCFCFGRYLSFTAVAWSSAQTDRHDTKTWDSLQLAARDLFYHFTISPGKMPRMPILFHRPPGFPNTASRLIMAVAQRIDLNHYAVLDANPLHEPVGAEIEGPSLDFEISGRLARDATSRMSIPDKTIDSPVLNYLRRLATIFEKIRARASLFNQLAAAHYGFGE
jgi:hypothetical protein